MLIINANVLTMEKENFPNGYIKIEDERIVSAGNMSDAPTDDNIIDANGGYAVPGFIDAHCHLGLFEDGIGFEGDDANESSDPITPHLRVIDAVNPMDRCFKEALDAGVTTVIIEPGSANVLGGQSAAIKTYGRRIDDMIVMSPLAVKAAFGENPKTVHNEKEQSPITRMASAALIREALFKAGEYMNDEDRGFDFKSDALIPLLDGSIPLHAHAHRSDDIFTALRIAAEFGIKVKIVHATDGHLVAEELAELGVDVLVGPSLCERSKPELRNLSFKTPVALSKAGIKIAIITDHPVTPINYLPLCAALAIREGMDEIEALKAVTINAAEISGIDNRVGSIAPGKDADILIFDRFPLDFYAKPLTIITGGRLYNAE